MTKKIKIVPKYIFDQSVTNELIQSKIENTSFISILDPDNEEILYVESPNFLQVKMWDVEMDVKDIITNETYPRPQDEELEKIVKFVNNNKEKDFYIHCSAGISRSGAVGRFIQELFEIDSKQFYKDNPYIKPNLYILKRLKELWQEYFIIT